jgi:uncharacterized membrane protein YedE/YeeE
MRNSPSSAGPSDLLQIAVALSAGVIFGFGLALSGMLDPKRVRGFLDVAGAFDPTLGFVLAGALVVSGLGYALSRRTRRPLLDVTYHVPARHDIDLRLLGVAAIFGVGWGMAGLCPGPAIASLSLGLPETFVFTATMLAGILLHDTRAGAKARKTKGLAHRDADAQS